jgi:hypothetical protein
MSLGPPLPTLPRASLLTLSLAAGLLLLPACGGGESKPTVATVEVSGKGRDVKVKAPRSIKGGLVQMDLKNTSDGPRDAQIVRVEGQHTPEEFIKVVESQGGPIPDWIQDGGGVGTIPPGQTGSATQNLAEGNYFVFSAPEGEAQPATAEFKVEAGGKEGELPEATGEIVASEYTFEVEGLKAGKNKVLFKNEGKELHHAIGMPIKPGKTIEDVKKYASQQGEPSGPSPVDEQAGFSTAVLDGGVEQVTDVELKKPGKYALLCFIQNRKGGPPHVMMGMIKEVEVQ